MRKMITVMLLALSLALIVPAQAEFLYPATAAEVPLPPIPLEKLPVVTACDITEDGQLTARLDMPCGWDELTAGLSEATVRFGVGWDRFGQDRWIDLDCEDGIATGADPNLDDNKTYPLTLRVEAADGSFSIALSLLKAYGQCSWCSEATGGDTYTLYYDDERSITGFSFPWEGKRYDYDYADWNGERVLYRYAIEQPGERDVYSITGVIHNGRAQWTAWGDLLEATVDWHVWSYAHGWAVTLGTPQADELPEGETDPRDWQLPATMERPQLAAIPDPAARAEASGDFSLNWTASDDQLVCVARLRYDTYLPDWGYEFSYDPETLDVQTITCPLDMYLHADFDPEGNVKTVFFNDMGWPFVWTETEGWNLVRGDINDYPGLVAIGDPTAIECPLPLE